MMLSLLTLAALQAPAAPAPKLVWRSTTEARAEQAGDQFGRAVSAGASRAVVSAWRRDGNLGGADVYRVEKGALVFEAMLSPSDGFQGSMCGTAAHVNETGDVVVLSALGDDTFGPSAGAAYLFRRQGEAWAEEAKLFAPDASEHAGFGSAVVAGDGFVVLGSRGDQALPGLFNSGSLYAYAFDGQQWQFEAKLLLPEPDIGDGLGSVLDLSGGLLAAGVPSRDNEFGDSAGAVYVYRRGPSGWQVDARVVPDDLAGGDGFGLSVALDRGQLLVGSTSSGGASMAGSVYLFERGASGWVQRAKLTAPAPVAFDFFGETLDLRAGLALVSARESGPSGSAAVHVYDLLASSPGWTQTLDVAVPGGLIFANPTVALGGRFALVGEALHGANVAGEPSHVGLYARRKR